MMDWIGLRWALRQWVVWWLVRDGGFDRFGPNEDPQPNRLPRRRRRIPSRFDFLGGIGLVLAGLAVAVVSAFSLSMFGYFLWRMVTVDNLLHQL
jgi:hypothetical protein